MNGTANSSQKMALAAAGFPESENPAVSDDVLRLEFLNRKSGKPGGMIQIVFGKVNIPFRIAAPGAVWLADEAQAIHSQDFIANSRTANSGAQLKRNGLIFVRVS